MSTQTAGEAAKQMNQAKPIGIMVKIADLELVRKALFDAMDDMREYQQVTDVRLSNCSRAAVLLNQWTDTLPSKACRVSETVERTPPII